MGSGDGVNAGVGDASGRAEELGRKVREGYGSFSDRDYDAAVDALDELVRLAGEAEGYKAALDQVRDGFNVELFRAQRQLRVAREVLAGFVSLREAFLAREYDVDSPTVRELFDNAGAALGGAE